MKPTLRIARVQDQSDLSADADTDGDHAGFPLPPEMQNRPDASELRQFIDNFQEISDPEGRRTIMDAVIHAVNEKA